MSMTANEKMLAGNASADASYIPMLLNLNTNYVDSDTDLCIRYMFLCCINCQ